ncbi:MAG TPA: CAP domain-containing protein, partial [Mycobacterium sp.]|nr:CAP domain-containing protein [Mycobacterium sp.]
MVCTLLVAQDAVAPAARADASSINNNDENSVNTAYGTALKNYLDVPAGWTGSTQSCAAGAPSAATQTATLSAINFVRSLSGLDDVSLDATLSARAQQAALMMAANNTLNHTPPTSWKCYSDTGAAAAGMSNLAMSWPAITGAGAISQYMADGGSNNLAAGHRRWILNPTTTTMGSGTTATTNALQVFGARTNSAATAPQWIPWPSAGYFPGDLEPAGRWSLSASSAKTTFAAASVTVRNASGTALPVTVHPTALGYGPNTLVWDVTGLAVPTSAAPATYTVTV